MSIEISLDSEKQRVFARVHGRMTLDEIKETAAAVFGDPALRPGFTALSDHTRVDEALSTETVHGLAAFLEANRDVLHGARWAVVTSKQASFGMMRMGYRAYLPQKLRWKAA